MSCCFFKNWVSDSVQQSVLGRIVLPNCFELKVGSAACVWYLGVSVEKGEFHMFKIFHFDRSISLELTRKSIDDDKAVNMSCRCVSPSVFSASTDGWGRSLVKCPSLELVCTVVAKCLQTVAWKTGVERNFCVKPFLFLLFFNTLFAVDREKLFLTAKLIPSPDGIDSQKQSNWTRNSKFSPFPLFCCCCQSLFPLVSEWCREDREGEESRLTVQILTY